MSDSDGFETGLSVQEEIPTDIQAARQTWNELEEQQQTMEQLPTSRGVGGVLIDRGYAITFFDSRA
jgi:hypothetical protein